MLVFSLSVIVLSTVLVGIYRFIALRQSWVDIPNQRSSHHQIVPRGAGTVILIMFAAYWLYQVSGMDWQQPLWLWALPITVGLVGVIDDYFSVSSLKRFIAYVSLSVLSLLVIMRLMPELFDVSSMLSYPVMALFVLAMAWVINLYNFMDGINGIAGFEALYLLGAAVALDAKLLATVDGELVVFLAAVLIGFLVWNFPFGKVFLGDAGSTFLGAFMVILAIKLDIALTTWLILAGVFLVDSSYTLATRVITGQVWHQAHRSHAYQILARSRGSHTQALMMVMLVNLLWLLPLAFIADRSESFAWLWLFLAYLPLLICCYKLGAGLKNN